MLLIRNRGFNRSYVHGGSGIFSSIANAVASFFGKEAIKQATTQLTKKVATEAGKKLGEKGVQKVSSLISPRLTSKSEDILMKHMKLPPGPLDREHSPLGLTSKSQNILRKYTAPSEEHSSWSGGPQQNFNLNALIDGSAIRIEDYIKRWK